MTLSLAPIALFVYKRPFHTLQCLESLAANSLAGSSTLFVFCDGAKKTEDQHLVQEVRKVVHRKHWCGNVHVIHRDRNLGLARSIIQGVTEIIEKFGSIIVLEDDLLLAPHFLDFMNEGLEHYRHESRVMLVTGYQFPAQVPVTQETCLLPIGSSWSWATWDRAWQHFDPAMPGYEFLMQDPFLRYRFDLDGTQPYFQMLQAQKQGTIDSWAIRWYLSVFLREGLALFPTRSLVGNLGFDGTGTHCDNCRKFDTFLYQGKINRFPQEIQVDRDVLEALKDFFRRNRLQGLGGRLPRLRKWLKRWVG